MVVCAQGRTSREQGTGSNDRELRREERGKAQERRKGERGGKLKLYFYYKYIPIFFKNYITSRLKKYQPARFLLVG